MPEMKKWLAVLIIALLLFPGMNDFYCDASANADILSDLKLLEQLETAKLFKNAQDYSRELCHQFSEGSRLIELMDGLGSDITANTQPVGAGELLNALCYEAMELEDYSMLYRDSMFSDYYAMRTEKVIGEYVKTGKADLNSFMGSGGKDFSLFMSGLSKDAGKSERIILLLQEKLISKMYNNDLKDKSGYFDRMLALRAETDSSIRNKYIYELIESRVRIKLLEELVNINNKILRAYLEQTKVLVRTDKSGILSLQYTSDIEKGTLQKYTVYLATGIADYKLYLPLSRFTALQGNPVFTGKNAEPRMMSRDSLWNSIRIGADGGLEVSLENAFISDSEISDSDASQMIPAGQTSAETGRLYEEGKKLENYPKEVQNLAQDITRDLNTLDNYLDLKDKGISNSLTAKFESGKEAWLKAFDGKLNRFNKLIAGSGTEETGFVGFLNYVNRYVDYNRRSTAAGMPQSKEVLVFRDSVLQFRQIDEGLLWIIDMLYKVKYQ